MSQFEEYFDSNDINVEVYEVLGTISEENVKKKTTNKLTKNYIKFIHYSLRLGKKEEFRKKEDNL